MSSYEAWREHIRDAGYGPEDVADDLLPYPTEIVVTVFRPTTFVDYETGAPETHVAPCGRSFPLFMSKAAHRFADYLRRKHGDRNVHVDYE